MSGSERDALPAGLTVPEAARRLRIPERTLRRYLQRHGRHLAVGLAGRTHWLSAQTLIRLSDIRDRYCRGATAAAVEAALTDPDMAAASMVPAREPRSADALMPRTDARAGRAGRDAAALTALEARIAGLEAAIGALADRQRTDTARLRTALRGLLAMLEDGRGEP